MIDVDNILNEISKIIDSYKNCGGHFEYLKKRKGLTGDELALTLTKDMLGAAETSLRGYFSQLFYKLEKEGIL